MSTNTLAAAFTTALTGAPKPASLSPSSSPIMVTSLAQAIPMQQRESPVRWTMNDELLLTALQHSLTPSDQLMARRTLLRPAPWEEVR